ncbi:MAG: methyl-accepting chemotaxis protein [Deltaproteobacteria bacterium]|nr:methyl-accepting chemotaxis protein [Deltaproteobacteria bacterium]
MKIKHKFLAIFVLLILLALSVNSYINFKTTETAVVQNAIKSMENELEGVSHRINAFHEKAGGNLIFALNYPVFKEYFSLPETRAGNRYNAEKVIQFSAEQRRLKKKIDDWTLFVQSKFPVAETCVIDSTGQEHSRITFGEIAPDDDFSSEENAAPFFDPTMRLAKGEFHVAYPYMSADAHKWVFSYTSPIALDDGSKPGFYHFEIPISYFQETVAENTSGRTFVIDPAGMIVADSRNKISIDLKSGAGSHSHGGGDEHSLKDYLPSVNTISGDAAFTSLLAAMKSGKSGHGDFDLNGEAHYLVYRGLPTFNWSVVQLKSYSELLEGKSSLGKIKKTILFTVIVTLAIAIVVIFVVSDRITKPLLHLTNAAKEVAKGNLNIELPEIKSRDEIADLNAAMSEMVGKLKEIVNDVESAAEKVTEASGDIKANSDSMSEGMAKQAAKATQIATASEEMSHTIIEIASNTSSIASTASQASSLAEEGEKIVERSINEVRAISEMVGILARNIESLGDRSQQIGKIVGVINEIAEQTNLLALNAAIEAARAGDQGRGFAVVADEVRNLSERTAKSTTQINAMIKTIQVEVQAAITSMEDGAKKVGDGVQFSVQAGRALGNIVDSVKNLNSMVEQIATATTQLTSVSEQISMDIGSVASLSQDINSGADQISGATGALTGLSGSLQEAIRRFKV